MVEFVRPLPPVGTPEFVRYKALIKGYKAVARLTNQEDYLALCIEWGELQALELALPKNYKRKSEIVIELPKILQLISNVGDLDHKGYVSQNPRLHAAMHNHLLSCVQVYVENGQWENLPNKVKWSFQENGNEFLCKMLCRLLAYPNLIDSKVVWNLIEYLYGASDKTNPKIIVMATYSLLCQQELLLPGKWDDEQYVTFVQTNADKQEELFDKYDAEYLSELPDGNYIYWNILLKNLIV